MELFHLKRERSDLAGYCLVSMEKHEEKKTIARVIEATAITWDNCRTDTGSVIAAKTGLFPTMRTQDPLYG